MIFMSTLASVTAVIAAESTGLVTSTATEAPVDRMSNFITSLDVMWKGMLGIFVVMGVILLLVYLLSKFSKTKAK